MSNELNAVEAEHEVSERPLANEIQSNTQLIVDLNGTGNDQNSQSALQGAEIERESRIRTGRQLIIIPAIVSLLFGLIFIYVAAYKQYPDDPSGLSAFVYTLICGSFFLISALIATVCFTVGIIRVIRAGKPRSK